MPTTSKNQRGTASEQHTEVGRKNNQQATGGNTRMRGFASMDPELQRRIASEGGRASHMSGRGHQWTSEEAREAGRKGGKASQKSTNNTGTPQA